MPIQVEVWGDYACFTRPEMKTERVIYDVMTPSAARGLLESIYWHPGLRWVIDRIHVCAPIRFTNIRRNEVKDVISARRAKTVMEKGQCYSMPYFGTREFPAQFRRCTELPPCPDELKGTRDLGWMLWDLDYSDPANIKPKFFRASLVDGVMIVPPPESREVRG